MAASVPTAGACGHRFPAPISSPATQPPCTLLLHSLRNQAAASECSSSKGEGRRGEGRTGEGREGEGEEHAGGGGGGERAVAGFLRRSTFVAGWLPGTEADSLCARSHTLTHARAHAHTSRAPSSTKPDKGRRLLTSQPPHAPSIVTDVWLSLESLGPFTLSSCQTEERNHCWPVPKPALPL